MASASVKADKYDGIDTLDLEQTKVLLKYSLKADAPVGIEGAPGVGKSAIVADVANEMNMPFEPLILSLCDPTDIGGFPVAAQGQVSRLPLGPIKRGCDQAVMLFLDELTCAAPAVQGAAMRLVYERWAGDIKLHPGTRIVAAFNPSDQAAGGWELALPLLGRMTKIRMKPKLKEIQAYFYRLGEEGSVLRSFGVDWAATLELSPDLLQIDPPSASISAGRPWGAPRSWERAFRVCAAAIDEGEKDNSDIIRAALAGNVGEESAQAYISIRKVRHALPSIKEVLTNPKTAKLPSNTDTAIAILGILAQVSQEDPCPAWIYSERLERETRAAAMNVMGQWGIKQHKDSKFYKDADAAQTKLLKSLGDAMRNS